jgi:hypothetical protein
MIPARTAWKAAHRRQRIERRTGCELYRLACECAGVDPAAETFSRPMMYAQRIFKGLERAFPDPERTSSDRFERTRDVLNSFGRLNPWNACYRPGSASYRDAERVHRLRRRLLERRLIAPEPGGYVTGLLSEAPAKMWWEDYGAPLAPMSRDDLALYENA